MEAMEEYVMEAMKEYDMKIVKPSKCGLRASGKA